MKMRNPFVAIIGAGQLGAATAQRILEKGLADVALFDVVEGLPQGRALDLMQAAAIEGHDRRILGTNNYSDIADAEVIVIAAGLTRKLGMSREDLLLTNGKIVSEIALNIKRVAPGAKIIMATNPLDVMSYLFYKITGFPEKQVVGMAGVLDSARMRYYVAEQLDVNPSDVGAVVLGGHGDLMVPILSQTTVHGEPIKEDIPEKTMAMITQKTKDGGAEIIRLLKTGSAFYAPASSIGEMVSCLLKEEKKVLTVSAYLNGEYGIKDIFCGVPAELSRSGIGKIIELNLTEDEMKYFKISAEKIRQGIGELAKNKLFN